MQTIILCGGQGTRIREASELKPKPMLEIGGLPVLWHIMKIYASQGHTDFVLALGHLGPVIKKFFLDYRPMVSDFTVRLGSGELSLHGGSAQLDDWAVTCADTGENTMTGGRVGRAAQYLKPGPFMVTYGDGVGDIDLDALLKFHRAHGKLATVCGVRPPGRFGELAVEKDGRVAQFNEKPQVSEGYINGGFMVFEPGVLGKYVSPDEGLVLEQGPLMSLAKDGQLMMYPHQGFWQPMDTLREYQHLNALWAKGEAPWKTWKG
jgi:glucose-1-phosphate cytidylyltransferase